VPLTLSLVTAFVGFTMREYAAVSFVAVLAVFLLTRRRLPTRSRALILSAAVLWVCAAVALVLRRSGLVATGDTGPIDLAPLRESVKVSLQAGATLASCWRRLPSSCGDLRRGSGRGTGSSRWG